MQGQEKHAYSEQKHHKTIHVFFIRKSFIRQPTNLKNPKAVKKQKMLRKFPASNTLAAILKNTDFYYSSLKVTKLSKF